MPFTRNVEIGRVALINYGAEAGKLVVIVDVVDHNRILVDRPGELRRVINLKRVAITDVTVSIPRSPKRSVVAKALEESGAFEKFAASAWGKKLAAREAKKSATDFDRYVAGVAKARRNAKVRAAFNKLAKSA